MSIAYHAVQRQMEYGQSHPLSARRHHATYLRLKRARAAEDTNPKPPEPCACDLCTAAYAKGRA